MNRKEAYEIEANFHGRWFTPIPSAWILVPLKEV